MGIQPACLELPRPDAGLVPVAGLYLAGLAQVGLALLCQGRCLEKETSQTQKDNAAKTRAAGKMSPLCVTRSGCPVGVGFGWRKRRKAVDSMPGFIYDKRPVATALLTLAGVKQRLRVCW